MYKKDRNWKKIVDQDVNSPRYIGDIKVKEVIVRNTLYDEDSYSSELITDIKMLKNKGSKKQWIEVVGLHEADKIMSICNLFDIHPLTVEDILNTAQNSKQEEYKNYLFINLKELTIGNDTNKLETSQLSVIYMENLIITFKESETETLSDICKKLESKAPISSLGMDALLYEILDDLVDNYFLVLDEISEDIDNTEDALLIDPQPDLLHEIYRLKRILIYMRKVLWPTRNILNKLSKEDYYDISNKTTYYFRDIYDHTIQMIDIVETYRDICSGMLDTYLSSISNKTNDIMKVLTIFSTISVPLTFLTGVYGMNFINQPELHFKYGYHIFWIAAVGITFSMLYYFRKKKWI